MTDRLLRRAQEQRSQVLKARQTRRYKGEGARLLDLADKSMKFLDSFSGILQIATGIDPRFGPIAYGSVAVLLRLASNKKRQDELITTMLNKFSRSISRLEAFGKLESSNPKVCELVIGIYMQMVTLLRATARYYAQASWGRVFESVTKPPTEYLQQRLIEVNESVADLTQELMLLQYTAVNDLLRQTRTQADDDHRRMIGDVTRAFGHSEGALTAANMQVECEKLYSNMFSEISSFKTSRPKPRQLQQATWDMLAKRRQYQEWERHPSSCLLLLGGDNARGYDVSRPCWISPIAPRFYSAIREAANSRAIFCSLVTLDHWQHRTPVALLQVALKSMIWQLLNEDPSLSRLHSARVCSDYEKATVKNGSLSESNVGDDGIGKVLQTLLGNFRDVLLSIRGPLTLYIVLDGIDKLEADLPTDLFRHLLDILDAPQLVENGVVIKVLAICFSRRWPNLPHTGPWWRELKKKLGQHGRSEGMHRVFADLEWKQPREVSKAEE